MQYYVELTLVENAEYPLYKLWGILFDQLHSVFINYKDEDGLLSFGLSFPKYVFNKEKGIGVLGDKLRIFADVEKNLSELNIQEKLKWLWDNVHITNVHPVPNNKINQYAIYRRKQFKTNVERLARRYVKRHKDVVYDDAIHIFQDGITYTKLPFIQLNSISTKQNFRLFIEKIVVNKEQQGKFGIYGLSNISTVPEF